MAPAPAPAMDAEGEGGGGTKNQSSMVAVKTEAVCTGGGPLVATPDLTSDEGDDTTECSSSFGDTCSGSEGEADGGEPEVNSGISAHPNAGRLPKPPRRKKVTVEWRNSVRPILWRCQWLELRMKELSSQVSKYDRELALIKKEKELQQTVSKANGSMSKSMEIDKGHGNSIMKRRKRKRHEDNVDAALYINKHQILSYYHDKQNKGAETDGVLIDDDCGSTVDGSIRAGLDTVTLLDSENYDMIFEQLTLKDTLMTIDDLQSRVHLLQDRLSKAHSGGENLALSEDNTHVRVPWKSQHTQKRSFSYTKCRYTKPQKKINLNILLKDEDGLALAGRPALHNRETDTRIKYARRNAEGRTEECNQSTGRAVTVDLLLGTDNSIPNNHIEDLCKENTDDILIDNQAASEACQQLDKAKHTPSGTSSKGQNISSPEEMKNISAPVEVKNTCAPVETDSTSAPVETDSTSSPVVEPISPQNKKELKPKKRRRKKGSFFTKKHKKDASKTPSTNERAEGTPSAAKNKTESTPSDAAVEKTESTPSGATRLGTMTARSAGKKRKTGNEPGSESAASKKQGTGKPSSAAKKQKTVNSSPATKKQETENMPSAIKEEAESAPLNLKIEKAVLVAVNSRRSQRVRKPKVFAE